MVSSILSLSLFFVFLSSPTCFTSSALEITADVPIFPGYGAGSHSCVYSPMGIT